MRKALGIAVLAVALAGCGGGGDPASESSAPDGRAAAASTGGAAVEIRGFIFGPDPLEIDAGTTVTWTNTDGTLHDVTSGTRSRPDDRFGGDLAADDGTFAHKFDRPGRYRYFCSLHSGPGMTATVIVR